MGLLDGKTAIVTGAARGIGKAIALKFAAEGANIAFTDLVIDENAEKTRVELEAMGVKAKGYASNAANFEDTAKVVEEIHKDFGRIDILVNNAGITRDGLMMRMSEQQWDMVINVNLKSAFNFIHAVSPVMMKQKSGSIINMSSVVGVSGNAGLFSNATEVARIYQMLLNGGELDGKRYLSPETCRVFTTTVSRISRRGLGFDKPDRQNPAKSPCAAATPSTVYGHTGFTGTCAWVDPTNGLVYVFLCNRIYPNVWNTKLMKMDIRTRIQEVMYQAVK